jgi:hypothetical protein
MEDFEKLLTSWINGNRKTVFKQYLELPPTERYDFIEYVKSVNDRDLANDIFSFFLKQFLND